MARWTSSGCWRSAPVERLHLAAQLIELVEQGEHQRHGLLLDREVVAEVADQADPRQVEVREHRLRAGPAFRLEPSRPRSTA